MSPELTPNLTTDSGFVTSPHGRASLESARKALHKSLDVFEQSQKAYRRRPPRSIGGVPSQAAQKPTKTISAIDRSTFELVLTKSPYLTYEDQLGNRLLLNVFLPERWRFEFKDGRSREGLHARDWGRSIVVPSRRLLAPHPLLAVLHELGHVHTSHLTDPGYWTSYDRANHIYHHEDLAGIPKQMKRSISPNEVLYGQYYPAKEVIDNVSEHYRDALLEIHRFKIADEYFAWAWALLTLSNIHQAGFKPTARATWRSTQNRILKHVATHLRLAKMTTGRVTSVN